MVMNKFASDDPYVISALLQTAQTNQADLNVVVRETDHLRATAVTYQAQGLTSNPANPVPNVTIVAVQTVGTAIADGSLSPDGTPRPGGGGFEPIQE